MCLAVPGRIMSIEKMWACVDMMGVQTRVNIQLIDDPKPGDYLLIHAGCAIQRINTEYFSYLEDAWYQMMVEAEE